MKIVTTTTQIECTADELRQSNTASDGLLNAIRHCFNGLLINPLNTCEASDDERQDNDEE